MLNSHAKRRAALRGYKHSEPSPNQARKRKHQAEYLKDEAFAGRGNIVVWEHSQKLYLPDESEIAARCRAILARKCPRDVRITDDEETEEA